MLEMPVTLFYMSSQSYYIPGKNMWQINKTLPPLPVPDSLIRF